MLTAKMTNKKANETASEKDANKKKEIKGAVTLKEGVSARAIVHQSAIRSLTIFFAIANVICHLVPYALIRIPVVLA